MSKKYDLGNSLKIPSYDRYACTSRTFFDSEADVSKEKSIFERLQWDIMRRKYIKAYYEVVQEKELGKKTSRTNVFERLMQDTNKRTHRELKISELTTSMHDISVKSPRNASSVFKRLLQDNNLRTEREILKKNYQNNLENEEFSKNLSPKTLSKKKIEEMVNRLQNNPKRKQEENLKNCWKTDSEKILNSLSGKNTDKNVKSPRNAKIKQFRMTETEEIEQAYGLPGSPYASFA